MSKNELIRRSMKALEDLKSVPPKEQIQQLVRFGTINDKGEVLMGKEAAEAEAREKAQQQAKSNGIGAQLDSVKNNDPV